MSRTLEPRVAGYFGLTVLGALVWGSMAPFYMLLSIYLRSFGIAYGTIGLISAASVLLSSLPQVLFGGMMDKYGKQHHLISLSLLLRSFCFLMISISGDVWSVVLWHFASSLALAWFMPAIQSSIARAVEPRGLGTSMGLYRLGGAAGWAVMCLVSGYVASASPDFRLAFGLGAVTSFAAFMASLATGASLGRNDQNLAADARKRTRSTSMDPKLFYLSVFAGSLGIGATSSFLTILLAESGGDVFLIGAILAVGATIEVPAMFVGGKLSDTISAPMILSIGMAGLALTYWLYGAVDVLITYLLVQAVRGVFYAFFTVSGMTISSDIGGFSRGGLHAGLYNLTTMLGSATGPYFGGLVSDQLGLRALFAVSSLTSLLGSGLAAVTLVKKPTSSELVMGQPGDPRAIDSSLDATGSPGGSTHRAPLAIRHPP